MIFDSTVLSCCADEIAAAAVGKAIRDFHQPRRLEVVLELDIPDQRRYVTVSAEAERARCHLSREAPSGPGKPYPFQQFGRKHLKGARVLSVRQVGFDRVLRIEVESRNPRLVDPVRAIVAELMGKHSNVLLLSNVDQVLEAMKHITANLSRARTMLPHQDYAPPPTSVGRDPREASAEELLEVLRAAGETPLAKALLRAFDGMSRPLVEELAYLAGTRSDAPCSELPDLAAVAGAFRDVMDRISSARWEPVTCATDRGDVCYPFSLAHMCRPQSWTPVESIGDALARSAETARRRSEVAARHAEVVAAVQAALSTVRKRIAELEEQADDSAGDSCRHRAECLLAALTTVPAGVAEATVPDIYDPSGPPLAIALDPSLTAAANANRLFDRARRLKAAARRAPELLARATADAEALERALGAAGKAETAEELQGIQRSAQRHGARIRRAGSSTEGTGPEFPTRFSSDGFEIVYGRNAQESDEMLRTVSAPTDWWLHARDQRGGHVIVRTEKRPERVPRRTLEEAARLAACLSKSRHSSLVPVDYTLRKYVRKARKGAPGLHIFEREKTLMVEPLRSADEPFA